MQAAPLRTNDGGLEEGNVFHEDDLRLLKTKAIYGSNASGKSNLIEAMSAFYLMVLNSVSQEDLTKRLWNDRFKLLVGWESQPMFFQYIFVLDEIIFRYGFEILDSNIKTEWLFGKHKSASEKMYFMRNSREIKIDDIFVGASIYTKQASKGNNELFRSDALFLTGAALNGNKIAARLRTAIREIYLIEGLTATKAIQYAFEVLEKGTEFEIKSLKDFLKSTDTGISDLEILDAPDSMTGYKSVQDIQKDNKDNTKNLFVSHNRYNENGRVVDRIVEPFFQWVSKGTSKLLGISSLSLNALNERKSLIIDEFDARFHPNLTLKIVELFQSEETNPKNAQFIFITHDSSLLRRAKLRRDQICFVDKDKYGISTLRTLIEYKGVRKDASYEKEYLQGSYAGVPYLDELDSVITQTRHDNGISEAK